LDRQIRPLPLRLESQVPTHLLEGYFQLPTHHKPAEDLLRIGLKIGTQQSLLGFELSPWVTDQHPAHGHSEQARGVPHGRLRSDLNYALPAPVPVSDLGRFPNGDPMVAMESLVLILACKVFSENNWPPSPTRVIRAPATIVTPPVLTRRCPNSRGLGQSPWSLLPVVNGRKARWHMAERGASCSLATRRRLTEEGRQPGGQNPLRFRRRDIKLALGSKKHKERM
jgi:hypothetical protein